MLNSLAPTAVRGPCVATRPCRSSTRPAVVAQAVDEREVRADVTKRIKALGRQGRAKEAVAELASMAELGVQPDAQAATALLDACVRSKKIDTMESVYEELFGDLLQPDEITFAVLLRGFGECEPPRWNAISNTLNQMERTYGLTSSTATFNTLLQVCARTNDAVRGGEIIERMSAAGVEPDEQTVAAVAQRRSLRSLLKKKFG